MKSVYILDAVRTPVGNFGGALSSIRTDDLAAVPLKALIQRNLNVDWEQVEDVLLGCANQAGEDNRNIARMSLLLAGLPYSIGGETINRLCSSGMAATINAFRAISIGEGDLYITGGVENMTRGPWVISKASKPFGRIPPVMISTASYFLIFFLKGLFPAAIDPIILNFIGNFFFINLVSLDFIAYPSKAALSSLG